MYRFVEAYRASHPHSSKDAALAEAGEEFHCSRSTVQRHIATLEQVVPVLKRIAELFRQPFKIHAVQYDLLPIRDLTERLAALYSPDELRELETLGVPFVLKLADEREELNRLRILHKRAARKKPAR